jgi:hypothetical protein
MMRSRSLRFSKTVFAFSAIFFNALVQGQELGPGLQAHGFISQSLVYTSDNQVGGDSDDGLAADFRELGANLSWRASPDWLFSGQALARWAGESDRGDLRLDYGFVDHTLLADGDDQVGVRVGKIKNPYGFFNTTRDVAHTRPGIIMPQSIYLDRVRNFFLSAPGVGVYGNHAGMIADVSWSIGAVRFDADDPSLEHLFFLNNQPGKFNGETSWIGQVMSDIDGGRWRLGLTLADVNMQYQPTAADTELTAGRNRVRPVVLSLERNSERFSITGEYSQAKHETRGYQGAGLLTSGLQNPNTIEAWYVQGTWRPSTDWRIYLRRDEIYRDKHDKKGQNGAVPGYEFINFAKDWTLGVRYDLNAWTFSAEYHKVHGVFWISSQDISLFDQKEYWDMVLLQAAWRF